MDECGSTIPQESTQKGSTKKCGVQSCTGR